MVILVRLVTAQKQPFSTKQNCSYFALSADHDSFCQLFSAPGMSTFANKQATRTTNGPRFIVIITEAVYRPNYKAALR